MSQARNLRLFIIYSRSILKTIEMICVWPVARVEGGHVLLLPPDGDVAHPVLPLQDRLLLWVQPTSAHRVSRLILAQRSLLSGVTSRLARRTWRSKYILKFHVSMILECLFFAITAAPLCCQCLSQLSSALFSVPGLSACPLKCPARTVPSLGLSRAQLFIHLENFWVY